ncbi:hypothetical protein SKAU_G00160010 [Synaphobranchus kaupii]|uniref:Uncharacterized protein n=1 Tax=Synaphobranchus kaupii TaxID=118154 RepID=A0A9Q1IYS9_SYNKA|nr:hypothetical protein SKAU_G00160010 [Synaphobranchus kaupii]
MIHQRKSSVIFASAGGISPEGILDPTFACMREGTISTAWSVGIHFHGDHFRHSRVMGSISMESCVDFTCGSDITSLRNAKEEVEKQQNKVWNVLNRVAGRNQTSHRQHMTSQTKRMTSQPG